MLDPAKAHSDASRRPAGRATMGSRMDLILNTETERRAEAAQRLEAFSGLNLCHVRGNVDEALSFVGRFKMLEEYTKHDMTHIDAMLQLYDWLIPRSTQDIMTPADWLLLTLTTYLHDFGLLVTRDEYDARDRSDFPAYRSLVFETQDPAYKDYRAQVEQMLNGSDETFLYQEFV